MSEHTQHTHTPATGEVNLFAALATMHARDIRAELTAGTFGWRVWSGTRFLRHDAPKLARRGPGRLIDQTIAALTGALITWSVFARLDFTPSGMVVLACLGGYGALSAWMAFATHIRDRHTLPTRGSRAAAGFLDAFTLARVEALDATRRSQAGADAVLAALDAARPGYEELVDELVSVEAVFEKARHDANSSEALRAAVLDARDLALDSLIATAAEFHAAGSVLAFQRDDLATHVGASSTQAGHTAPTRSEILEAGDVLPDSARSYHGQRSLTGARAQLAVAADLLTA